MKQNWPLMEAFIIGALGTLEHEASSPRTRLERWKMCLLLNGGWHIHHLTLAAYSGSSLAEVPFHPAAVIHFSIRGADGRLDGRDLVPPDALRSADHGTSIAGLTPMAWEGTAVQEGFVNMSRCYFQGLGELKEVWLDGTDWDVAGDILTSY
ncbi:hypothetical protein QBC46DRAFT_416717 [Diplogelasinospora grovesii]|uniref:Uncharacterized protein n=1 Tax=Diplogelasinospora grovesii TaxID=303347 RepID=A0AAN6S7G3_9PEZI|nr:hypothetical protein QBC46DRAFT_416717 [Diplogelasinospora grovesii]